MAFVRNLFLFGVTALAVLVLGCSTSSLNPRRLRYSITEPLQPRIYAAAGFSPSKNEPRVENLTPTLEWKPVPGDSLKYDLSIHTAYKTRRELFERGIEVYYREGLEASRHTLEVPLQPHTYYCWSVRTRSSGVTSKWASYDLDATDILGDFIIRNSWWTFATP